MAIKYLIQAVLVAARFLKAQIKQAELLLQVKAMLAEMPTVLMRLVAAEAREARGQMQAAQARGQMVDLDHLHIQLGLVQQVREFQVYMLVAALQKRDLQPKAAVELMAFQELQILAAVAARMAARLVDQELSLCVT